ncbi:MAG TPA: peptidylprolyl isomerase [Vicinamibacterales bacterium]|nr:peptidylprolyl isomerase [Vicinamibacterales bacterium]
MTATPRALALGLVAILALTASPLGLAQGQIVQKIIVKVNGEIFTQTELEKLQIQALRERNQRVPDPKALETDAALRAALSEVTPLLLIDAIEELLLTQRARDLGVKFTEASFQEGIANIKKQNNLDDAQFTTALAQEGLTLAELRKNFERSYMMQAVQQLEIYPRLRVTEEEVRQYYRVNGGEFTQPETVMLREIFLPVQTQTRDGQAVVNVAEEEGVKARMDAARERIVKGEAFAAVAAEVSEAPSKANGGLIGPVEVAQLAPAMKAVIDGLQVGDVSEPLRTSRGFQMLSLESRSAAEPRPFAEVSEEIMRRIQSQRADAETARYLDGLRAQAQIEWKDETYRALYQQQMSARAKGAGLRP